MFAYCGNNPVVRIDVGGSCWNVLAGAVVGALIGAASQAICNIIDNQSFENVFEGVANAAVVGALGGALVAAFPAANTAISVGMSVAESVQSDINDGKNLATIVVNATLSAGFAVVTSGTSMFENKGIIDDSINALKSILPGNHPDVKKRAGEFLVDTGKDLLDELGSGISEGVFVHYVSDWTENLFGLITGDTKSYDAFTKVFG